MSEAGVPTLQELQSMSLAQLESVWALPVTLTPPRGRFRGHVLRRIDHATSRRRLWRYSERLGFEWIPFGVDFDRRLWFFFTPHVAMGRFQLREGESRWRIAHALRLTYAESRLPRFVRSVLYDEVKPLSEQLILGLGGINRERGAGDHFFFALQRASTC